MNATVTKPRLLRVSYFIWLIVPLAIYVLAQTKGLPHMRWSYSYIDNVYRTPSERYYSKCTYAGFNGIFVVIPANGACDFIALFKAKRS